MKQRRTVVLIAVVSCILFAVLSPAVLWANPDPPSYDSFKPADFSDIYLTPILTTGTLDYVLSMGPHPKIKLSGQWYDVNWIQSYFVVGATDQTDFVATNGTTVKDWFWEDKQKPGRIAGWVGDGSTRIHPLGSKPLGFASLDLLGNTVVSGIHLGYQSGSSEATDWYRGDLPPVPEPSGTLALLAPLPGLIAYVRRSRPRR